MKLQVNRDVLSEAVSFVVRLLPQRPQLEALSGVLVEAEANQLKLSIFDFEVSAQATVVAQVDKPGKALVSGRLLAEIANKLPIAPVEINQEDSGVILSCGSARFELLTMSIDEYPNLPDLPEISGKVEAESFTHALQRVAIAAAKDDPTPTLTAVVIDVKGDELSLTATDRFRVATQQLTWQPASKTTEFQALVPARIMSEISKTFGQEKDLSISFTSNDQRELIAFSGSNRVVTSSLIKGVFPNIERLFDFITDDHAIASKADLVESTRRVSLVTDRDGAVRYTFKPDSLVLESSSGEKAKATETIQAELNGEEATIALKPQYVLDALSGITGDFVKIIFTKNPQNPGRPSPVIFTNVQGKTKDSENFRYILQPKLF